MSHLRPCSRPGCGRKETFWSERFVAEGGTPPEPPLCRPHQEEAFLASCAAPPPSPADDAPTQIQMIGALLVALGHGDHARAGSPREVWEAALDEVKTLTRAKEKQS